MNASRRKPPPTEELLVEIGTEELPPKALARLGAAFSQRLSAQLHATGLTDSEDAGVEWFAAPRRLAVRITAVRRR
ncbi:MAG: glycine--tRNA ligase subunit beta, partial [Gammaproteobacteria bacterium]|nr:glycine--tRNA ligase subunit beta [Gammaproteobacteria bacterium]